MIDVLDRVELSSRLSELHVDSPVLGSDTRLRVLSPPSGDGAADRPVLWLLHGGDDDFRSWTDAGSAEALTAELDAWVVMPDCGPGGWYTDWFRVGPAPGTQQWETHHLVELRDWFERSHRTRTDRDGSSRPSRAARRGDGSPTAGSRVPAPLGTSRCTSRPGRSRA